MLHRRSPEMQAVTTRSKKCISAHLLSKRAHHVTPTSLTASLLKPLSRCLTNSIACSARRVRAFQTQVATSQRLDLATLDYCRQRHFKRAFFNPGSLGLVLHTVTRLGGSCAGCATQCQRRNRLCVPHKILQGLPCVFCQLDARCYLAQRNGIRLSGLNIV